MFNLQNKNKSYFVYWSIFLIVGTLATTFVVKQIYKAHDFVEVEFTTSDAATVPTLSLEPRTVLTAAGQIVSVDIHLDTAGQPIDGVDIFPLRFNPAILQVVDDNPNISGVQITPASLLPITVANSVNNASGEITFSQATTGGTSFNGSGVIATIHFNTMDGGVSNLTFDFESGDTTDSNLAYQGNDRLASVINGGINVDNAGPTVTLTAPASNATVSGTSVTLSANATDNVQVAEVRFRVDNTVVGTDNSAPYSITWNSTTVPNGTHEIVAVAYDTVGNLTESLGVFVNVNQPDTTNPSVSITAPTAGANVQGNVTVSATASDNVGVAGVQFKVGNTNIGSEDTSAPYSVSWNVSSLTNGPYALTAVARDTAGNSTTSSTVNVNVNNPDTTQPTVSITAPTAGSTVLSTVNVTANASDNVGVVGVQFKVGTTNISSEDTTSPYSVSWNTTTVANGNHSLTAVARDAAGNTRTSTAVSVVVNNPPPNTAPVGTLEEVTPQGVVKGWSYDPDNSSSSNTVRIYADGAAGTGTLIGTVTANINRPDVRNSQGITGNHGFEFTLPSAYLDGRYHSIHAHGVDLTDASLTPALTGSGKNVTSRTITLNPEARTSKIVSGTLEVLSASKQVLKSVPFTTNTAGQFTVALDLAAQNVYFKFKVSPFLIRMVSNINLSQTASTALAVPQLFTGDLNQDNFINSLDYSILNTNWFTSTALPDLNGDGIVNSIDFSFMNIHWLTSGDQ